MQDLRHFKLLQNRVVISLVLQFLKKLFNPARQSQLKRLSKETIMENQYLKNQDDLTSKKSGLLMLKKLIVYLEIRNHWLNMSKSIILRFFTVILEMGML